MPHYENMHILFFLSEILGIFTNTKCLLSEARLYWTVQFFLFWGGGLYLPKIIFKMQPVSTHISEDLLRQFRNNWLFLHYYFLCQVLHLLVKIQKRKKTFILSLADNKNKVRGWKKKMSVSSISPFYWHMNEHIINNSWVWADRTLKTLSVSLQLNRNFFSQQRLMRML